MIPLFALSDSHIAIVVRVIIDIPSSQLTMLLDHSIHLIEAINAITSGVNVVIDQANVVLPFNLLRYIVWPDIRATRAPSWKYIAFAEGIQPSSPYSRLSPVLSSQPKSPVLTRNSTIHLALYSAPIARKKNPIPSI